MTEWNIILSFFWKGSLGVALIALTALFVYLCRTLGSLRNSLSSIQNTLNSTENLVNQEVGILITDVSQTVKEINKELPQLLQNINGVTASIQQISENEVQPTLHNVQELSETLNQSVQELESVVEKVSTFSGQTIEQAEYFRNQVAVSLADIVSMWHGLKAGWDRLSKSSNSNGATQSNAENSESQAPVQIDE
jgi:uncharacterized protein YoxC